MKRKQINRGKKWLVAVLPPTTFVTITNQKCQLYQKRDGTRPPPNYLKHNSYEKEYSRSLKDLDLVYEDNPDTIPSLEQLYAMLLETLEKIPENH